MESKRPSRALSQGQRNTLAGLLFVSPWIIGFLVFGVYPILASLYYSMNFYDGLRPARWVGLDNYVELLARDRVMGTVTYNTLWWVALAVPAGIVAAFLLANLLNIQFRGRSVFRAIFFIPSVVPAMVTAIIWRIILGTNFGLVNATLASMGIPVIPFLSNPTLAKPTMLVLHCWAQGGAMVIFLAALQEVPREFYEAALVDGASAFRRFWHITVPLCTPSAFFMLITGIVGGLQAFTFPWLLTGGGPNNSTEFFSMYLYRNAFAYLKMGYASALAWILAVIAIGASIVAFRTSRRWVFYAGE